MFTLVFEPVFPRIDKIDWNKITLEPDYISTLRTLIEDFRKMVEIAKRVDILSKQPDCADPEKLKLEERVKELEAKLNAIREASK